jgi:hypothetical protein
MILIEADKYEFSGSGFKLDMVQAAAVKHKGSAALKITALSFYVLNAVFIQRNEKLVHIMFMRLHYIRNFLMFTPNHFVR